MPEGLRQPSSRPSLRMRGWVGASLLGDFNPFFPFTNQRDPSSFLMPSLVPPFQPTAAPPPQTLDPHPPPPPLGPAPLPSCPEVPPRLLAFFSSFPCPPVFPHGPTDVCRIFFRRPWFFHFPQSYLPLPSSQPPPSLLFPSVDPPFLNPLPLRFLF